MYGQSVFLSITAI